jgi:hypothetical protein
MIDYDRSFRESLAMDGATKTRHRGDLSRTMAQDIEWIENDPDPHTYSGPISYQGTQIN